MKIARLGKTPADYHRLGIQKEIAPFEDGHRTRGKFGEYEWWYNDVKMDDGSSLVIIFFSQPVTAGSPSYAPSVSFSLTRPGQETLTDAVTSKDFSFSREGCDVRIGNCTFKGDLHTYELHYQSDAVTCDLTLTGKARPWRPHAGYITFGEKDYFAWLPSVPEGEARGSITLGGETIAVSGTGYHDHNWGNKGMFWLMHHWYWGRARIGEYQVISSYITARKRYGYEHFPIFLLNKNGERLADNGDCVTYTQQDVAFDPITQKTYHKTLIYDYNDGAQHYRITYRAEDIIETFTVAQAKTNAAAAASPLLLWLVKLARLQPSYIRMTGTVTLEKWEDGIVVETVSAPAIWEQMHFGLDEDV